MLKRKFLENASVLETKKFESNWEKYIIFAE